MLRCGPSCPSFADEQKLQTWLGAVLNLPLADGSLHAQLKSGVVLCELLNAIKPGAVPKISKSNMPFPQVRPRVGRRRLSISLFRAPVVQRENVKAFIDGARALGLADRDNFDTADLFDEKNMRQVVTNRSRCPEQCVVH